MISSSSSSSNSSSSSSSSSKLESSRRRRRGGSAGGASRLGGRGLLLLTGLLLLGLAAQPCRGLALTTFGKSSPQNGQNNNNNNNNNQNNDRQNGIQARECSTDSECTAIKGTTCLESIFTADSKLRCLCGDYREPRNGRCDNQYKGVKVLCNNNEECTAGAQCMVGNSTTLLGKRCYCMQGYVVDEDMQCSGSQVAFGFSALSLVASLLLTGSV